VYSIILLNIVFPTLSEFGRSGNYKKVNYQLESNQNSPSHQHSHNHHHHNHCRHVQQRQSQHVQQEESMTTATVHGM
jgi:hypothetical protein